MAELARPGVEIQQQIDSPSVSIRQPTLVPCVIAPCYKIVDAFDSAGDVAVASRAGTYANGLGTIAYNFPSLPAQGVIDSTSVRVFLEAGSSADELNAVADETVLQFLATANWSNVGTAVTLAGGSPIALDIVAGDTVRLYLLEADNGPWSDTVGDSLGYKDCVIAVTPSLEGVVTIAASSSWGFDITATGRGFALIKNAAQFEVVSTAATATRRIMNNGTPAANNGIDFLAELAGVLGDSVTVTFVHTGTLGTTISAVAGGGFLVAVTYDQTVTTWSAVAADIQTQNDLLPVGARPFLGATGVVDRGTGADAVDIPANLVAHRDTDTNGIFLLDGGRAADTLLLDADLLDTVYGITSVSVSGFALLTYRALRVDVSPTATVPSLLKYNTATEMIADIGPVDTRNPLALMFQKAFDNSPTTSVAGIGLNETSITFPDGTVASYTAALDFLSSKEVYAMAPFSQVPTVHQLFLAHVNALSAATEKHERVVLISRALPTNRADVVVSSGTADGELLTYVPGAPDTIDFTAPVNFPTATVAVNDAIVFTAQAGPFDLGNGLTGWRITVVAVGGDPSLLQLNNTDNNPLVGPGTEVPASIPVVGENLTWTIYRPGQPVTSNSDRSAALAAYSAAYAATRVIHVVAPEVAITVGSAQARLPGSYAAAAVAGQFGELPPEQPMTNVPMAGIDAVYNTNDAFSTSQLNEISGGGSYILIQESNGGPVFCRHQNTTDVTVLENQAVSIRKTLDFVAKYLRTGLKPFVGRFNITAGYVETIATVVEGYKAALKARGTIADLKINSITPNSTSPNALDIDLSVSVYYPGDYLRVLLRV